MKTYFLLLCVLASAGCSTGIKNIDTTGAEPSCVRQCTLTYSQCASGGPSVGFKTETLSACKESYEVCIGTCKMK